MSTEPVTPSTPPLVDVIAAVIADNSVVIHEHPDYGEMTASTLTPDEMAHAVLAALGEAGAVEWGKFGRKISAQDYHVMLIALTAAAPFIRAQALEDAADAMEADTTFRDPLRLRADWLRNRAKQERGEGL